MKQLTCEVCGSIDFVKQGGLFVCQDCGMKYSVEDAKKMISDGAVEIKGSVVVKNSAQLDNLMTLAHSSFDSKNYVQAEEFCNQAISMDALNYDAWKLKGESVYNQINKESSRIDEAFNCIITSYKVLNEDGKDKHREEILSLLKNCLEGEVKYWLTQFETNRASKDSFQKAVFSYEECRKKVEFVFSELELMELKAEYINNFDNLFIFGAKNICSRVWKSSSAPSGWIRPLNINSYYMLIEQASVLLEEVPMLVQMLEYVVTRFDEGTTSNTKISIFEDIVTYSKSVGFGQQPFLGEPEIFEIAFGYRPPRLPGNTIADWNSKIDYCKPKIMEYSKKIHEVKSADEIKRKEMIKKRRERYWESHVEEKLKLETEKNELQTEVSKLELEIKGLGIFKFKEKKILQARVDSMRHREEEIELELTKDR